MKKNGRFLIVIAVFIGLFLTWIWAVSSLLKSLNEETQKYKDKIGEVYVLEDDTLTIVDYSSFNETYTLSNGIVINKSLVE